MSVYLVGAGPGDPGLLTIRAAELLAVADVVVHDRLVDVSVLSIAANAELIDVGKRRGQSELEQDEINALLVARALAGQSVVRLKGGDPYVFGRGGEEALALEAAGIHYEVVPGVLLGYCCAGGRRRAAHASRTFVIGDRGHRSRPRVARRARAADGARDGRNPRGC